ncbi:uncharacterized protein DFL_009484 [Arthrobotrys flagrans]|uniref:Uncharacterized protein n=1 Tax=Arthrobotrys flagrans TaxID=97331 RepID=A0A436ZRT3_ARTFL|nr:hypothetical protein DFL_009484 [Arthrobotrys flagrans]
MGYRWRAAPGGEHVGFTPDFGVEVDVNAEDNEGLPFYGPDDGGTSGEGGEGWQLNYFEDLPPIESIFGPGVGFFEGSCPARDGSDGGGVYTDEVQEGEAAG